MKTLAQSLTISAAIYSIIFILLASFAFGAEKDKTNTAESNYAETSFAFEEEEYVDDIPFDTRSIAENYRMEEAMSVSFELEDEAYVDDIPFNTYQIASEHSNYMATAK